MIRVLIGLVFIANIAFSADISLILKEMIKAYGGEDALNKSMRYHQTWKVLALQTKKEGVEKRKLILPHTLKTTISYLDKVEKRVLSLDEKFIEYNGKRALLEPLKLQAMQLQLKRLYNPLVLKNSKNSLTLEDYDTHYVLVLSEQSQKLIYFVEKNTFVITQVTGIIYAKHKIIFETLYTKFKRFNNVLFPTKEYKSANGMKTAILELEEMTVLK